MKILISNDDGVLALGIRSLANGLARAGHQVYVVCPDQERSATGHGLTLHQPIRAEKLVQSKVEGVESLFHPSIQAWACSGTPADCVKLGLWALLESRPDFVLAGINHGPNLGTDVLYSGTVSAAMEGMIENIPSIAFSLASYTDHEFTAATEFAVTLLATFEKHPPQDAMLLNVNIPPVPPEEIAGVTLAYQGVRRYIDIFEQRTDPRGKNYYWLAGELLEEETAPGENINTTQFPMDVQAIRHNYITITPLQYNLTDTHRLQDLSCLEWLNTF